MDAKGDTLPGVPTGHAAVGAESPRSCRRRAGANPHPLANLASPTPRERLRLEPTDRYGDMARSLDEALAEGNGEKAVRLYFDLVDQVYGKPAQSVEVRAGPIPEAELATWSDERVAERLAELEAMPESSEHGG